MDKENVVHICNGILAMKKELSNAIDSNMDAARDFIKLSKAGHTVKGKYHLMSLTCGI